MGVRGAWAGGGAVKWAIGVGGGVGRRGGVPCRPSAPICSTAPEAWRPQRSLAFWAGLPQAHHGLLADVGHAPYCEDAASFNSAIEAFLDKVLTR